MSTMTSNISTWHIGDVKITRVLEGERAGPLMMLPDATPEALQAMEWLRPHFADADGNAMVSIHALVLETPSKRIVVDTCLGNDKDRVFPQWNKLQTRFMEDLELAGYPPDSIDTVMCTHLHTDHVGWNTKWEDGEWKPTFKNADYLFGEKEWEYTEQQMGNPMYKEFIVDSIQPIIDAGLVKFVNMDDRICDEIWMEPTPGHTPGHISLRIDSKGEKAAITGDFLHHPCQMQEPRWLCTFDWNREAAEETRVAKLGEYADEDILVFGTHFATPSAGHVVREGDSFRYVV